MIEEEVGLGATEPGVPSEEPESPRRHVLGEVVLREVDVVVGRDERGAGRVTGRGVVETLARMATGPARSMIGDGRPMNSCVTGDRPRPSGELTTEVALPTSAR